jgi:hypothetical protein
MNFQDSVDADEKSPVFRQLHSVLRDVLALFAIIFGASECARGQSHVEYVGGTGSKLTSGLSGSIEVADSDYFAFYSKKVQVRVPYRKINLLEYGQSVNRRVALAIIISPAFILTKKRKHFLTVGYADEEGKQQALVFRVDKNGIRATLASLEARTGLRIQFQDEEARKAGRA